jgi:2-polyprenyl-3-methyl-5-hydroxy-6-metoxy-1,4-benzoquinol methylase
MKETKEAQNQGQIKDFQDKGPVKLGPWTSHIYRTDPRHLVFLLSRYKFCSKLLMGKNHVLEIGCGDGFGIPVILQSVKTVHGIDFEPQIIENMQSWLDFDFLSRCSFEVLDIIKDTPKMQFDAVYSLDVIEHISKKSEKKFINNIVKCLLPDGICIIGTPNVNSQAYASEGSKKGHINLKSAEDLKELLLKGFENVFIFSMNDEVVHTGFYPMAHYLIGVGIGVRK